MGETLERRVVCSAAGPGLLLPMMLACDQLSIAGGGAGAGCWGGVVVTPRSQFSHHCAGLNGQNVVLPSRRWSNLLQYRGGGQQIIPPPVQMGSGVERL